MCEKEYYILERETMELMSMSDLIFAQRKTQMEQEGWILKDMSYTEGITSYWYRILPRKATEAELKVYHII